MSIQTSPAIYEVIANIHSKKYLLPSTQMEFIWSSDRIAKLFDSLMRDYPINKFMFWKVSKKNTSNFRFYELRKDHH